MTKEPAMPRPGRTHRLFWIAGILLLVGTVLGAGYVINNGVGKYSATPTSEGDTPAPPGIVSIGHVDMESGVTNLFPVQQGRVTEIVKEGIRVKKGDILLRIENRVAAARVKEAKADVSAAREMLRQAEKRPEQHKQKLEQQKSAIEAVNQQKAVAENVRQLKAESLKLKVIPKEEYAAAEAKVKAQTALLQVEEGKLQELMLVDPEVDVERARADLAAKEARCEQAQVALDECDLRAPSDGQVLRVLVHKGEIPKSVAIQFAPAGAKIIRAEVLQEWASKVTEGQDVTIADDTSVGPTWTGRVKSLSPWYSHKRSVILEPFTYNDVRTLECLIEVTSLQADSLRIGQRVRVTIQPK
jgi:multidrug resistance efflux pump